MSVSSSCLEALKELHIGSNTLPGCEEISAAGLLGSCFRNLELEVPHGAELYSKSNHDIMTTPSLARTRGCELGLGFCAAASLGSQSL